MYESRPPFRQGDIIWMNCDPHSGHEQSGTRPALVVNNDVLSEMSPFTVICPITNTDRNNPLHVRLDDRTKTTGVILAEQMRSVDAASRNARYVERAPNDITMEVLDILAGTIEAQ